MCYSPLAVSNVPVIFQRVKGKTPMSSWNQFIADVYNKFSGTSVGGRSTVCSELGQLNTPKHLLNVRHPVIRSSVPQADNNQIVDHSVGLSAMSTESWTPLRR